MAAARWPPRSEPQNSHDFLPRAMPRSDLSAALFDMQMRSSSRKQRERRPALEHVLDRLGEIVPARELDDLGAEIGVQSFHQRPGFGLSHGEALLRALAIDGALGRAQRVDAAYDFDGDRRERDLLFARRLAARVRLNVGHGEERTPGMDPARRLPDRPRLPVGQV